MYVILPLYFSKLILKTEYLQHFLWNWSQVSVADPHSWYNVMYTLRIKYFENWWTCRFAVHAIQIMTYVNFQRSLDIKKKVISETHPRHDVFLHFLVSIWCNPHYTNKSARSPVLVFTHCGLVMPCGNIDRVNTGSGNGLVPDSTKPLPAPMLTIHQ